jgi:hypothetical protein
MMIKRISNAFVRLILLGAALSPIYAMAPTHKISADVFGVSEYRSDLTEIAISADHQSVKGVASDTDIFIEIDPPTAGVSGGAFTGNVALCKVNVIHHNNRDCIYGVASGTAFSNGFQVNYLASVTIIGGDARYAGAAGAFNLSVYQSGIQDLAIPGLQISSEIILDGQYSLQ